MATALIIIDMQVAFFQDDELASRRAELVATTNALIDRARSADAPIIGVRTVHADDRSTWTLNMLDDDQGFLIDGDADAQYVDGLDMAGAHEITKTRDSAFWQTNLLTYLREHNVDRVVLAGVSTHLCILQSAVDAYNANLRVVLATDAIASCRPELHQPTIDLLRDEYRMAALPTGEIDFTD